MDTLYFLVEEQIYVYREISKILLSNFFPFLVFHVTVLFSRKHQYLLNKQKSLKINEGTRFVNNQCTFLKYIDIFFLIIIFLEESSEFSGSKGSEITFRNSRTQDLFLSRYLFFFRYYFSMVNIHANIRCPILKI